MTRLVWVAVPVPALGLLTYRIPPAHAIPVAGARVVVPLGKRTLTGVVVGEAGSVDRSITVKDVIRVLDEDSFVPADVIALTQWVADYYLAGPGAALSVALPPHGLSDRVDRFKRVRVAALTAAGLDAAERLGVGPRCTGDRDMLKLGGRQREALLLLKGSPDGMTAPALGDRGISSPTISRLKTMGLVAVRSDRIDRDPFDHAVSNPIATPDRELTPQQRQAVATLLPLIEADAFRVALVHGVTGSGKTEVYLRLADATRRRGRGVLMMVPEIALTPQVASIFRACFGSAVAIQHSGLSDGERHDQWHRIRRGEIEVVVGTRSAVFAPLANPGLIIVDEEHDTSYKQDETPRYHGRDVAIMRAKFTGAVALLGSATPTLESYANAVSGRYTLVTLDRRVKDRPLAAVQVVNMREEIAVEGQEVVLSPLLRAALQDRLDRREQSLILLNRRGFATSVLCRQCGLTLDCPNCSVSLTIHSAGAKARCHYCNFVKTVPRTCENCAAPYMQRVGFGTERVESELRNAFPAARIARVDRDTIRRKGSLVEILARVASRDIDILIGTQMIAKGHDFPDVTLVGVISADVGLGLADFRSAERTFQLLTQVAGRAGRGERSGEAIVQSLLPQHYSVRMACAQDYRAFYDKEVEFRNAMRYPPRVAMVNVVVRGRTLGDAMTAAQNLADAARNPRAFTLLGPAPAPLTKLRGEHRAQFFLKGTNRKAMREALQLALSRKPELSRRVSVDVDPLSML